MFAMKSTVRMNDTDMAGLLFFANLFHFAHNTFEDFAQKNGFAFSNILKEKEFLLVIVHAEADYLVPLGVSDPIVVELRVKTIGNSSFSTSYRILREGITTGTVGITHVAIDPATKRSIPIPEKIRKLLELHLGE